MKSLLRARSFNLFVHYQIRNYLRKLCLTRVTQKIEQYQRNDDSVYENAENRFTYRFREFSNHILLKGR